MAAGEAAGSNVATARGQHGSLQTPLRPHPGAGSRAWNATGHAREMEGIQEVSYKTAKQVQIMAHPVAGSRASMPGTLGTCRWPPTHKPKTFAVSI